MESAGRMARTCFEEWLVSSDISDWRENVGSQITFIRVRFVLMRMAMVVMVMLDALHFCVASGVLEFILFEVFDSYDLCQCFFAGFDQ